MVHLWRSACHAINGRGGQSTRSTKVGVGAARGEDCAAKYSVFVNLINGGNLKELRARDAIEGARVHTPFVCIYLR